MTEPEVWLQLEDAFRNREWTRACILADALQECGQEDLADTVRWASRVCPIERSLLQVWSPSPFQEGFLFRLQNPDGTESKGTNYVNLVPFKAALYAVHRYRQGAKAYYGV